MFMTVDRSYKDIMRKVNKMPLAIRAGTQSGEMLIITVSFSLQSGSIFLKFAVDATGIFYTSSRFNGITHLHVFAMFIDICLCFYQAHGDSSIFSVLERETLHRIHVNLPRCCSFENKNQYY